MEIEEPIASAPQTEALSADDGRRRVARAMTLVFSGLLFLVFDFTVSFGQGSWELDLIPDLLGLVLLGLAAVDLVRVSAGQRYRALVLATSSVFAAHLILRAATFLWQGEGSETLEPWNQFLLMVAAILLCTALAELARCLDLPLSAASWRRSRLLILVGPFLLSAAFLVGGWLIWLGWKLGLLPESQLSFSWNLGELLDRVESAAAGRQVFAVALTAAGFLLAACVIAVWLAALIRFLLSCLQLRRETLRELRAGSARVE